MAQRVRLAIGELGYRQNTGASNLRRAGSGTSSVGLVLEDVANPFSSTLHRAIEDATRESGYLLLAGSSDGDPTQERELVTTFWERRVDGIILVPGNDQHEYLRREIEGGTPVVLVDRTRSDLTLVDSVTSDNVSGARVATQHLIDHGHRELLFLGDRLMIETASLRREGFRQAVAATAGVQGEEITGLHTTGQAEAAVRERLTAPHPPTAIFASQNLVTIGAVRALHRMGFAASIALVGFDDFPLADVLEPGVTVVAQDPAALGRRAAEIVLRRIAGDASAVERVTIGTRLIPRGSGELRP